MVSQYVSEAVECWSLAIVLSFTIQWGREKMGREELISKNTKIFPRCVSKRKISLKCSCQAFIGSALKVCKIILTIKEKKKN